MNYNTGSANPQPVKVIPGQDIPINQNPQYANQVPFQAIQPIPANPYYTQPTMASSDINMNQPLVTPIQPIAQPMPQPMSQPMSQPMQLLPQTTIVSPYTTMGDDMYTYAPVDRFVILGQKPTIAYCKTCNSIIKTSIKLSPWFFAYITPFFLMFLFIPLAVNVDAKIFYKVYPYLMCGFVVLMIVGIIIFVIKQTQSPHICPRCKTVIGKRGDTVRIPAQTAQFV